MSHKTPDPWWRRGHHLMMFGCVAVMALALVALAGDGQISWLGTLFLLACPLMHLLMMRGMGRHGCHEQRQDASTPIRPVDASADRPTTHKEF